MVRSRITFLSGFGLFGVLAAWLVLASIGTARAAGCTSGTLIKGFTGSAVYYCGADGKRYVFVNDRVYNSWYADFSGVTTVSDADLASIQIGGNATYRPGVRLVKIQTDPKVYAVSRGGIIRWVKTEELATALYGSAWSANVHDIPVAFFTNYAVGADIAQAGDYNPTAEREGTLTINDDRSIGLPLTCIDSDAGDVTRQGMVTRGTVFTDVCVNPTTVREYTCIADGTLGTAEIGCGTGYACASGACVTLPPPSANILRSFVLDSADVCFVGDVCTGDKCCTIASTQFEDNANLKAVFPRDKFMYADKQQLCGRATLSDLDRNRVSNELATFTNFVSNNTANRLNLSALETRLAGEFTMSRVPGTCEWWFSPADLRDRLVNMVDAGTDHIFVIGSRTFAFGDVPISSMVRTAPSGQGIRGAGYSYILKDAEDLGANKPFSQVFLSAWGDQFASALKLGITDPLGTQVYTAQDSYPACTSKTIAYFPSLDACVSDPDVASCGSSSCSDLGAYHSHVLQTHYNPAWRVVGNHCRDGKKDMDETGVDCGGSSCNTCP